MHFPPPLEDQQGKHITSGRNASFYSPEAIDVKAQLLAMTIFASGKVGLEVGFVKMTEGDIAIRIRTVLPQVFISYPKEVLPPPLKAAYTARSTIQ